MSEKWIEVRGIRELTHMLQQSGVIVSTHSTSNPNIPEKKTWPVADESIFWSKVYAEISAAISERGLVYARPMTVAQAA